MSTLTLHDEPRAAPCFICATEPRLEGHVVCTAHHDDTKCTVCQPHLKYRGTAEHEHTRLGHGGDR